MFPVAGATDDVETLEDEDEANEEEGNYFSSDDTERFNTVIDTQKLQRLLDSEQQHQQHCSMHLLKHLSACLL